MNNNFEKHLTIELSDEEYLKKIRPDICSKPTKKPLFNETFEDEKIEKGNQNEKSKSKTTSKKSKKVN